MPSDTQPNPSNNHTHNSTYDAKQIQQKLDTSLSRPQLNQDGHLRHFLGVEGLNRAQLQTIIAKAETFFDAQGQLINSPELEAGDSGQPAGYDTHVDADYQHSMGIQQGWVGS